MMTFMTLTLSLSSSFRSFQHLLALGMQSPMANNSLSRTGCTERSLCDAEQPGNSQVLMHSESAGKDDAATH